MGYVGHPHIITPYAPCKLMSLFSTDASKVPPSRFQKREGSIYATPGSRDGHTKGKERDEKYFNKLKEKVGFSSVLWIWY